MKYTKQQLVELYNGIVLFDEKMRVVGESLETIFDSRLVYSGPHPIDIVKIIDENLYEELSYILYECPDELCEFTYHEQNIQVKGGDIDSFLKICEIAGLLEKE